MFSTRYQDILQKIESIDPEAYARTRNFGDGAVSRLSPYFSRGVIHPSMVLASFKRRGFSFDQVAKFVQEMAWREYFQNVLEARPEIVDVNLLPDANLSGRRGVPLPLIQANTGIQAIDSGLKELYDTGYMHNHLRMYTAALASNFAGCQWQIPARWMYYHLLDADPASNFCSWQWVAGCFNGKKYIMNQDNINHYFHTRQTGSFLDVSYDQLMRVSLPEEWNSLETPAFEGTTENTEIFKWPSGTKVIVFDFFNLDPNWYADDDGERILLMDTDLLSRFPVSEKTLSFTEKLSANISGIKLIYASFRKLKENNPGVEFLTMSHPLLSYGDTSASRPVMFPSIRGFYRSFSAFWKKAEPLARRYFEAA